jgi:hypothetical protein
MASHKQIDGNGDNDGGLRENATTTSHDGESVQIRH